MRENPPPATEWQEQVGADEATRFEGYAAVFARIQQQRALRWGPGRALHRKQLAAASGTLQVLDGLPPFAGQGLFALPREYPAWVRVSNGGLDRAADSVPDIRGLALRVLDVRGASALGGHAQSQDFTFINQEAFAFPRSDEFVQFVEAASEGHAALLRHLVRRHGVLGLPRQVARMARSVGRPFSGFATQVLHTAVPMANGPYAVRARLVPSPGNGEGLPGAKKDWGADFADRLRKGPLHWDLQLQYYASEAVTPIEDASVDWPTPYSTVARLMLPQQDAQSAEGQALLKEVEAASFDPWHALAEHRPLGEVQRARKAVYFASQKGRGAA